jgi:hypothetical protein
MRRVEGRLLGDGRTGCCAPRLISLLLWFGVYCDLRGGFQEASLLLRSLSVIET